MTPGTFSSESTTKLNQMKSARKPNKTGKKRTLKTKGIHKECGGEIKETLGNGKKYGSSVCLKCGGFFD